MEVNQVTLRNYDRAEGCSYLCLQEMTIWLLSSSQTHRGNWVLWKLAFPFKYNLNHTDSTTTYNGREHWAPSEHQKAKHGPKLWKNKQNCLTIMSALCQCWTSLGKYYFSGNQQIILDRWTTCRLIMKIFTKLKL